MAFPQSGCAALGTRIFGQSLGLRWNGINFCLTVYEDLLAVSGGTTELYRHARAVSTCGAAVVDGICIADSWEPDEAMYLAGVVVE
jgi:hypothetical protein